jgi:ABC-type glycerol-3-phosphate transport system substrate-binding protein
MKKFFSMALAALMCLSLLAGCGGSDTESASTGEGGESGTAASWWCIPR